MEIRDLLSKPVWQMTGEEFILLNRHALQEREARAEERQEGAEYRQQENQSHQQSEFSDSLIDTSALGAVDIFSVLMEDDHTHEYIDPAFRFGRKKKKKRRRRL